MKTMNTQLRTKMLLPASLISIMIGVSSCGNNSTKEGTENAAAAEVPAAAEVRDDGQGVGRFKDITLGAPDQAASTQGKVVFEAKCSACHNTTDVKKVGPGLKGITGRRKPAWILNMITNPQEMTQKDPTAKNLLAEHLTQMTFQDVSDDQAKQILEYFRQNDGN